MAVGQHHNNRGNADMTAGEGCRGTFAGLMCHTNKTGEEAVAPSRGWQHLGVAAEVGAEGREVALEDFINAYGLEVELRACDRHKDIDYVI